MPINTRINNIPVTKTHWCLKVVWTFSFCSSDPLWLRLLPAGGLGFIGHCCFCIGGAGIEVCCFLFVPIRPLLVLCCHGDSCQSVDMVTCSNQRPFCDSEVSGWCEQTWRWRLGEGTFQAAWSTASTPRGGLVSRV